MERLIPLILIAALTLMTLLALISYPKYSVTDNELLINPSFSNGLAGWQKEGKNTSFTQHNEIVILSQESKNHSSRLMQTINGDELADIYLVSAQLGSNHIETGIEAWQNGAVVLIRGDENNKRIGSFEIAGIEGTQEISNYQKFIEIPAPTAKLTLTARMLNATGELFVKSVSLKPATRQPYYPALRTIIIGLWVTVTITLIIKHLTRFGLTKPFLVLCTIAMLALIGTLMPKQFAIDLSASLANLMPEQLNETLKKLLDYFFPGYIGHANQEISKFGHWIAFFALTLVSTLFLRRTPISYIVISILVLAAATETLQFLTNARTPHIYDLIIDIAGVAIGLLLGLPVRWLSMKNRPS